MARTGNDKHSGNRLRTLPWVVLLAAAAGCGSGTGGAPFDVSISTDPGIDVCLGEGCTPAPPPDVPQVGAEFVPAPPEDGPGPADRLAQDAPLDVPVGDDADVADLADTATADAPIPRDQRRRDMPVVPTDGPGSEVPSSWSCGPQFYGRGDGCDCGCGVLDPDCGSAGCSEPGCTDAACDFCTDTVGQVIACPGGGGSDGGAGEWTCNPLFQGGDDGCDCGCGALDPDCGGDGCTEVGCSSAGCDYCYDAQGTEIGCDGGGGTWTCDPSFYDAFDGCDCGCGIPDPDCFGSGCTEPGCTDFFCDYCYDARGVEIGC